MNQKKSLLLVILFFPLLFIQARTFKPAFDIQKGLNFKFESQWNTIFQLSDGSQLLFDKNPAFTNFSNIQLSQKDKEAVYKKFNFKVSKDRKELFESTDENMEYPLYCSVRVVDFNNDGNPEIFVSLSNMDVYGQSGVEFAYTKDPSGKFYELLNIRGTAELLTTKTKGFPDILVSGPGMTAPTLKWQGTKYIFSKMVPYGADTAPKTVPFDFYKKKGSK